MSAEIDPVTIINQFDVEIEAHHILKGHTNSVETVKFKPTENHIIASGSHDHTIRIWDINTGKTIQTLKPHDKGIWALAWTKDGSCLISTSPDG